MKRKEHFPTRPLHPLAVPEKDINLIVAENLAYWMGEAKLSQAALAEQAGVSQKTISNYLNPKQRIEGLSGKHGSPKLYELDLTPPTQIQPNSTIPGCGWVSAYQWRCPPAR